MSHRKLRSFGGRSGFTLIELLLVVALLAMLTAVIWPSVQRYQTIQRADDAANTFRLDLLTARVAAIDHVENHVLSIRNETGEYRVGPHDHRDVDNAHMLAPGYRFVIDGTPPGKWQQLIVFRPDGTAGNATILIVGTDGEERHIECDRLTGSVRIGLPEEIGTAT